MKETWLIVHPPVQIVRKIVLLSTLCLMIFCFLFLGMNFLKLYEHLTIILLLFILCISLLFPILIGIYFVQYWNRCIYSVWKWQNGKLDIWKIPHTAVEDTEREVLVQNANQPIREDLLTSKEAFVPYTDVSVQKMIKKNTKICLLLKSVENKKVKVEIPVEDTLKPFLEKIQGGDKK